jgi:hypothetical protein
VRPLTSAVFDNSASWENGKWVYEALTHAHVPLDALDEGYLLTEDLGRYKAIVVSGSHIRRDAADKLARWVEAGGTLITTAGGLARDEADRPLDGLRKVLGLESRGAVEVWREVTRYGASALAELPPSAVQESVAAYRPEKGEGFSVAVGREVLDPTPEALVAGRFADGSPAVVRNAYGKGAAVTIGFYAGLEYASDIMRPDFDMPAQLNASKRAVLAAPVAAAGVVPPVEASSPLIETALMRHPQSGAQTILLMNWGYKGNELVPQEKVIVTWRSEKVPARVKSLWLGQSFPVSKEGEVWRVELPRVEDGDVLMVE